MHRLYSKAKYLSLVTTDRPAYIYHRFVWFVSGLIHLSLHRGDDEAWIQGGKYGLIAAADTSDVSRHGHSTTYPSDADTVALAFPLAPDEKFEYTILRNGPCKEEDMIGL